MKKIEEIFTYIHDHLLLEDIKTNVLCRKVIGIDAYEIEEKLGIVRNNASSLLNELCQQGRLVKIQGRPVRFITRSILEQLLQRPIEQVEYKLEDIVGIAEAVEKRQGEEEDPFESFIGCNQSLKNQIDQARAAIMYPPNGLHTILLGPSGVGKTTFAHAMYQFARKNRSMDMKDFVSLNCSDYFNNPQLLLSQLFGHVKGAFTGADNDKIGLVEKAHGGILFLDEIHRLPPDGQEMLFFLMDEGNYYRLGEPGKIRKSELLIIGATTEDPHSTLLTTFLRRIPVMITLPSLKEKEIHERVHIIESLLVDEAIRIQKALRVEPEVLKALAIYECKGNIGQLKSDIRFICAKAFLKHLQNHGDIVVDFSMLPKNIKDAAFGFNHLNRDIREYLDIIEADLILYPSKEKKGYGQKNSETIYDKIFGAINQLKEKGLSDKEIELQMGKEIDHYFKNVLRKFNYRNLNIRELYKIIDKEVVELALELIQFASQALKREFSEKTLFGFTFHLNGLIERLENHRPAAHQHLSDIKTIYQEEYQIASFMVNQIRQRLSVDVPSEEISFIALLLANQEKDFEEDRVGILVMSHGMSTATSMGNVCNKLLGTNLVKAIDMPLEKDVEEIYEKAKTVIKALDRGKGVLILVDMGSLKIIGDKITEETGIVTKTVERVSTPLVLEALRKVMYKNEGLEQIYQSIVLDKVSPSETTKTKGRAIITLCVTGKGTSVMLKNLLLQLLRRAEGEDIQIFPMSLGTMEMNGEDYRSVWDKYEIIACVGNINPNNGIPYFSVEDMIKEEGKQRFYKFIKDIHGTKSSIEEKSCYEMAKETLEEFLLYLNPKIAIGHIEKFIETLAIDEISKNDSHIINLAIHLGCMLERVISGNKALFEDLDSFRLQNKSLFEKVKEKMKILEKAYHIEISDHEIGYTVKAIHSYMHHQSC